MERLTAADLSMVWPEDFGWPQDIGALALARDGHSLGGVSPNLAYRLTSCLEDRPDQRQAAVLAGSQPSTLRLRLVAPKVRSSRWEWPIRTASLVGCDGGLRAALPVVP